MSGVVVALAVVTFAAEAQIERIGELLGKFRTVTLRFWVVGGLICSSVILMVGISYPLYKMWWSGPFREPLRASSVDQNKAIVSFLSSEHVASALLFDDLGVREQVGVVAAKPLLYAGFRIPVISAQNVSNRAFWVDAVKRLRDGSLFESNTVDELFDAVIVHWPSFLNADTREALGSRVDGRWWRFSVGEFDLFFQSGGPVDRKCWSEGKCRYSRDWEGRLLGHVVTPLGDISLPEWEILSHSGSLRRITNPMLVDTRFGDLCDVSLPGFYDKRWAIQGGFKMSFSAVSEDLRSYWRCDEGMDKNSVDLDQMVRVSYFGGDIGYWTVGINVLVTSLVIGMRHLQFVVRMVKS